MMRDECAGLAMTKERLRVRDKKFIAFTVNPDFKPHMRTILFNDFLTCSSRY